MGFLPDEAGAHSVWPWCCSRIALLAPQAGQVLSPRRRSSSPSPCPAGPAGPARLGKERENPPAGNCRRSLCPRGDSLCGRLSAARFPRPLSLYLALCYEQHKRQPRNAHLKRRVQLEARDTQTQSRRCVPPPRVVVVSPAAHFRPHRWVLSTSHYGKKKKKEERRATSPKLTRD